MVISRAFEPGRIPSEVALAQRVGGEAGGELQADPLDAEQQSWLQAAADASSEVQKRLWKEASNRALAAVAEDGVEILRPSKEPFAERVQDLLAEYREDPEIGPLIDAIQAVGVEGSREEPVEGVAP